MLLYNKYKHYKQLYFITICRFLLFTDIGCTAHIIVKMRVTTTAITYPLKIINIWYLGFNCRQKNNIEKFLNNTSYWNIIYILKKISI